MRYVGSPVQAPSYPQVQLGLGGGVHIPNHILAPSVRKLKKRQKLVSDSKSTPPDSCPPYIMSGYQFFDGFVGLRALGDRI